MAREMAFGLQLGSSCLTFDSSDSTKNGYVSPNLAQTSYVSTESTEGKNEFDYVRSKCATIRLTRSV